MFTTLKNKLSGGTHSDISVCILFLKRSCSRVQFRISKIRSTKPSSNAHTLLSHGVYRPKDELDNTELTGRQTCQFVPAGWAVCAIDARLLLKNLSWHLYWFRSPWLPDLRVKRSHVNWSVLWCSGNLPGAARCRDKHIILFRALDRPVPARCWKHSLPGLDEGIGRDLLI